jgi:DNA-binding MarR family transcriptional regulator
MGTVGGQQSTGEVAAAPSRQDVKALARKLDTLADHLPDPAPHSPASLSRFARELYRDRRLRDAGFPAGMFGEPAWDILLDLFASAEEGRDVSVSSACLAAAVPATTALRYLQMMEKQALIERQLSPADARVCYLRLSAETRERLALMLRRMSASPPGAGTDGKARGQGAPRGG